MWNCEEEVNEKGETVQIYFPVKGPARRTNTDTIESHVGGLAHQREAPSCTSCQDPMKLLAQLRLPNLVAADGSKVDRMLYTFCCARPSCFEKLKFVDGFAVENKGIMACQVAEIPVQERHPLAPVAPVKSSWYTDDDEDDDNDDDNDWGADSGDTLEGLEKAMAAMEEKLVDGALPKKTKKFESTEGEKETVDPTNKTFPCYLLRKKMEPPPTNPGMEEDDVGLSTDDDKIRNMLARYMAEEEDEDILAALKGTATGGGAGEEDERLSEEQRLFLGFQDRLRRVPRQVMRYARGGTPLWSIPSTKNGQELWKVPTCPVCTAPCAFEMQLLPSILHVLQVDQFSPSQEGAKIGDLLKGGINWGSVAVFTCTDPSCSCTEGSFVVQSSVDEDAGDEIAQDYTPTMAVVEDLDDDAEFEQYEN